LTDGVKVVIEQIIFYQRPLKLHANRIGKCSLESAKNRACLESQRFRYLQDIHNVMQHERN
jgi:hypothetical protein